MERPDRLPDWLPATRIEAGRRLLTELQIQFISCTYWRNRAPWGVPRRTVADTFFLMPVKGAVQVELDDVYDRLTPGHLLMLRENVPHRLTIATDCPHLEQIAVHVHLRNRWGLPIGNLFPHPILKLPAPRDWKETFCRLTCIAGQDPKLGQVRGELVIRDLLLAAIEDGVDLHWPTSQMDPRIAAALKTIHEHYSDDLSVRDLARAATLSEVQFRKQFLRAIGCAPRAYLVNHRLAMAGRLLTRSPLSVKEIAWRCGFHSDHYFHRCFREAHGLTPSAYRRQQLADGRI